MNDLKKVFIDLSKCSEEERKSIPHILENAGENIYEETLDDLLNDRFDEEYIYLALFFDGEWSRFNDNLDRTELTYPEFIKLFEGGETIKSDNTQTLANALQQIEKLEAEKAELIELLKIFVEENTPISTSHAYEFPDHMMKAKKIIQNEIKNP